MIRTFLAASLIAASAPTALAQQAMADQAPMADEDQMMMHIGPSVGDTFADFTALSTAGEAQTLANLSGEAGAVIVFSRSLDWCPFCKRQAIDLKDAAAPLAELGWDLNLITYDDPETLAGYAADHEIPYTLLSDKDSAMINAFHLRNTEVPAGSRYDGIPHPAIIFLSPEGEVLAMLREEGYQNRPPVDVVLETAGELAS